ncbi:threonine synthase [Halorientalis sp. IM1011]|uniref:threonine synthase n=1 Tax=Halorientalis sp. IM1011 TaxID=1932360 RepID=UPI00097CD3EB|nr:threonine synthase [Halorientalis sp. IM1011]AQL41781.1 threonine synthase [Halorientalis sp. IM1011]
MTDNPAVRDLTCRACGDSFDPAETTGTCPSCDGHLTVTYDLDAVDFTPETTTERRYEGIARYAELLPFTAETLVTMDEGATPLVSCPSLADEWGVGEVYVKDEGRNPTGSVADRGMAVAVTAAAEAGADDVALPTTGIEGQAAAAYAARAGLDSHSFVPSRATFDAKAMINVHGGDMEVVGGRYGDAVEAFHETVAEEGWHSLAPFETPYRREGAKTLGYELLEQLDWEVPDAVVYPTGEGVGLVGTYAGTRDLADLGVVEDTPAMYAAQAAGCAPIVEAFENGEEDTAVWETPDTICGGVEIPDPAGGPDVLAAVRESDGGAVATEDRDVLEGAVSIAQSEGVELGATAGVAASGAARLAEQDEFGPDDTLVLVNTLTGNAEADVLRSHLMSKGI